MHCSARPFMCKSTLAGSAAPLHSLEGDPHPPLKEGLHGSKGEFFRTEPDPHTRECRGSPTHAKETVTTIFRFLGFFDFSEKWKPLKLIIFDTFRPRDHEIWILHIESFQIDLDPAKLKSSRESWICWKSWGLKSIIFVVFRPRDSHKQIWLEESFQMT